MTIKLLDSIHIANFLSYREVDDLEFWIKNCFELLEDVNDQTGDKSKGQLRANYFRWNFYDENPWAKKIRELLEPKFDQLFADKQTVLHSHILESIIPYQLHTDYYHHHDNEQQIATYTILIPLQNYDSKTVVFNEYLENSNEFEKFKQNNLAYQNLQIDPKFCSDRLNHLYPKDLKYLTIKETFDWNKGDFFAVDRRYFHCSDNFNKRGIDKKLGIVMWLGRTI